jgi:hypothetical protein
MDRAGVGAAETAGGRCRIASARGATRIGCHGRDYYEQRFSPSIRINDKNVAQLDSRGNSRRRRTAASKRRRSSVDGVMYATWIVERHLR